MTHTELSLISLSLALSFSDVTDGRMDDPPQIDFFFFFFSFFRFLSLFPLFLFHSRSSLASHRLFSISESTCPPFIFFVQYPPFFCPFTRVLIYSFTCGPYSFRVDKLLREFLLYSPPPLLFSFLLRHLSHLWTFFFFGYNVHFPRSIFHFSFLCVQSRSRRRIDHRTNTRPLSPPFHDYLLTPLPNQPAVKNKRTPTQHTLIFILILG